MALSAKQQVFVEEYLRTWNATMAAIAAGYSEKAARVTGHRLLTNANIAEIERRVAEKAMSANEVLLRLAEQARGEHGKYISATGVVNLPQLIADGKGHLVKGIKETKWGRNIEFYDAQAALVQIGKHHGLFTEKLDINHSGSVDITADERAQADKEMEE
jgi:phage terminase small subunit